MLKITPNCMIRVERKNSIYTPGEETKERWEPITYSMGDAALSAFPCEWKNAFGDEIIVAEEKRLRELATIRMGFNPDLWEAINSAEVRIFCNGDEKNAYAVYGSADNVGMRNQQLEFKVKRME